MIDLVVKDYCHNCPSFEAVTEKLFADCKVIGTYIRCENAEQCQCIENYIKQAYECKLKEAQND